MRFEYGRARFGKIKVGQYWKKKDSGMIGKIVGRGGSDKWYISYGKTVHHTIERDIYRFYEKQ